MKRFLYLLTIMVTVSTGIYAQQKRALLIGIGNYPIVNGWKSLSSKNDIEYLMMVLPSKGFPAQNMTLLTDERATRAGIENAFLNLIASAGRGDIIMIHFSGHGQQITDDANNDEADGFDEAWIPYDAQARYSPTPGPDAPAYRGELHLRDDMIGKWLDSLSEKVGEKGSIFVSIDACHSGTATRSAKLGVVRGDPSPFRIPGKKNELIQRKVSFSEQEFIESNGLEKGNVITLSASSPTQVNYETKDGANRGVGSLTYAFSKAMAEMPAGSTYFDLFMRVKAMIQAWIPIQFPMMEGRTNQQIFSGQYSFQKEVTYIDRWDGDTAFTVKMGSLLQISPGAEFLIYDPVTGVQVATAVATTVTLVESLASIITKIDITKPWAIKVKSVPLNPYKLTVGYDESKLPKSWIPILDKAIAAFGFTEKSTNADCWITFLKDTGMVVVTKYDDMAYTDTKVVSGVLDQTALDALKKQLQAIARTSFFRSLPDGGPNASNVVLELKAKDGRKSNEHELIFKAGDKFDFHLKNKGNKPIYYSLVIINPKGQIDVLLPLKGELPQARSLQPGTSIPIPDFEIEQSPSGREFFKVVVSENPDFDIRPLFVKMDKKRANLSSWEQAMIDIMQPEPGSIPKKRSVQVNDVTILTQSYLIQGQ